MKKLSLLVCLAAVLLAGCDPDWAATGTIGPRITTRNTWVAGGLMPNAAWTVDGNMNTAATCDNIKSADLIIDLRQPCEFQSVTIEHGANEMGFARKLVVSTSADGLTYLDRYVGPDTRKVAILSMPGPVVARFVRIRVVTAGLQAWSVAEVSLQ